jgi:putative DNA primase/helicase
MLANSTLQTILDRLEGVKRAGNGYTARCPGHDDNRNSLSIKIADNGKILLHCFAGCKTDKICADIELDMQDLFPADTGRQAKRREIAAYDYTDESGNLLFQKVRYEPKDFRIRVPNGNSGWNWTMKGVRRVLYRLPAVVASDIVFVCEGEKDCDLLAQHGYVATCNYDGAGKWNSDYNRYFKDKVVYILPDNDAPGRKHAACIYRQIESIAADCRIVELPGLGDKGDVSDFFAGGGTVEQFNDAVTAAAKGLPESLEAAEAEPVGSADDWPAVVPFDDMNLPAFPLDAMPVCLTGFAQIVREASNSHQTPEDMTALLLMTIASACLGGKVKVVTNNRYTELATLFTAIFVLSGTRKSSVYLALMKPVIDYQKQWRADMRAEIEGNKNELDILKKQIEKLKKDIVKSGDEDPGLRDDLKDKEQVIAEFSKPVELPLIFMETDFTVESLAPKIQANGGTLSLFDHEGAFWNEVAGRYTQGQSQTNDLILKGYDGHPVTVSRVGRGDIFIERACLAIGLIVQPTKIEELRNKQSLDDTGLIPRFILAVPKDTVGYRKMRTAAVPQHIYDDYNSRIVKLLGLRQYNEIVLEMDTETTDSFMRYCESIEVRLREGWDLYPMRAWASKLTGRVARIAAVLHCFANPSTVPDNPGIDAEIVDYAIELSDYLIAHAKATYQILHLSPDVKIARKLLRTLKNYVAKEGAFSITKNDLWQRIKNSDKNIQTVASIAGALEILIDHNYIWRVDTEHKLGRQSEIYELNPAGFHPENPVNSFAP